jgi:VIT1/CCC1 family predicted Fe2+/Mn2+ transporter
LKDIDTHYLPQAQFDDLKKRIKSIFEFKSVSEEIAFTISMGDKNIIVINSSIDLSKDELQIVIQHETAHAHGIDDEEQADKWALNRLSDNQKDILISQWKHRHGHDYKSMPKTIKIPSK